MSDAAPISTGNLPVPLGGGGPSHKPEWWRWSLAGDVMGPINADLVVGRKKYVQLSGLLVTDDVRTPLIAGEVAISG
jgi:hypothetical protein